LEGWLLYRRPPKCPPLFPLSPLPKLRVGAVFPLLELRVEVLFPLLPKLLLGVPLLNPPKLRDGGLIDRAGADRSEEPLKWPDPNVLFGDELPPPKKLRRVPDPPNSL
jgi:hypothetical protein